MSTFSITSSTVGKVVTMIFIAALSTDSHSAVGPLEDSPTALYILRMFGRFRTVITSPGRTMMPGLLTVRPLT